jgi:hypothetical protein
MAERLRCEGCTGHVAYECDKLFMGGVAVSLFDEVIEERPAREFHYEGEERIVTEHAPGTDFAIDRALERRANQSRNLLRSLRDELDCGLSAEETTLALFGAVNEIREERPEDVQVYQQGAGNGLEQLFKKDKD